MFFFILSLARSRVVDHEEHAVRSDELGHCGREDIEIDRRLRISRDTRSTIGFGLDNAHLRHKRAPRRTESKDSHLAGRGARA
jgi:hypothetical protein